MNLCTWDAQAPGTGGSGVCDGADTARRRARAWMRENQGDRGTVTEVALAAAAGGIDAGYVRAGRAWEAVRAADGRVLFRPLPGDAAP